MEGLCKERLGGIDRGMEESERQREVEMVGGQQCKKGEERQPENEE